MVSGARPHLNRGCGKPGHHDGLLSCDKTQTMGDHVVHASVGATVCKKMEEEEEGRAGLGWGGMAAGEGKGWIRMEG